MEQKSGMVREGMLLGLVGYAAVAAFFAFFDLLAGRGPIFTLDLMGKVVFRGARDPAILQLPMSADVGAMVAYNFLHLGLALMVGLFVAWLVARVEERPERGVIAVVLLMAGYLVTISAVRALTLGLGPLLPFWSIVIANTLVALGGIAFLWHRHPGLWARMSAAGHRTAQSG